jgi:SAM-dependent methyltransferase
VVADDRQLADAFDAQAALFERAPVQTDAAALARLIAFADFPADSLIVDAGCGPGLVSAALLAAGHRLRGFDLSAEMIRRATARCASFGTRGRFEQRSIFDVTAAAAQGTDAGPFDGAISRFVIHHTADPVAFLRQQLALLRPGGVLVACDHTTDPDPARAAWHQTIEVARDRTHSRNLTGGALFDAMSSSGAVNVAMREEPFSLDFDEWFDRGTPGESKDAVRMRLLADTARGFTPVVLSDGSIRIDCWRVLVRGVRATAGQATGA